jgi:hypothetical protein
MTCELKFMTYVKNKGYLLYNSVKVSFDFWLAFLMDHHDMRIQSNYRPTMANGTKGSKKLLWDWTAGKNVGLYRKVVLEVQVDCRIYV